MELQSSLMSLPEPFPRTSTFPKLALALLVSGGLFGAPASGNAGDSPFAFWVWNRADPLTADERVRLHAARVERLYWQVGELELHAGELVFRRTAASSRTSEPPGPGLQIIPVVRVATSLRSPEQFSGDALGRALRPVADAAPDRELQLDFDCPDRLLPIYAERLRTARQVANVRRLSITALAGWSEAPAAQALWPAVDAVYPMLYDTQVDPAPLPDDPGPCRPRRLLDPDVLSRQLRSWSRCPIPWYTGLPVFARVTLYDPTGRSRGHLRAWDWEDLVFNPGLTLDRPATGGTTVLRATRATRIGENPVPAGGYAAVRTAERQTVRAGLVQAQAAGARGAVLFRLPDPPSPLRPTGGGWSLPQVLSLLAPPASSAIAAPRVSLHRAGDGSERFVLRNDSDDDLPARFEANGRGYELELELPGEAPGWREALPGDFRSVAGHVFAGAGAAGAASEDKPVPVAIPLARRLTFWFAVLPAHTSLTTGLVQLAPGVEPSTLRFRVPAADPNTPAPWRPPD